MEASDVVALESELHPARSISAECCLNRFLNGLCTVVLNLRRETRRNEVEGVEVAELEAVLVLLFVPGIKNVSIEIHNYIYLLH